MTEEKACGFKRSSQEEIFTAKIEEVEHLLELLSTRKENLRKGLEEVRQKQSHTTPESQWPIKIVVDPPVREDQAPSSSFFVKRILDRIVEAHPEMKYRLVKNEAGLVKEVEWTILGKVQEQEVRNTLAWTLKRIREKKE